MAGTLLGPNNEIVVKSSRYATLTEGERTDLDGRGYTPIEDADLSQVLGALDGLLLQTQGAGDLQTRYFALLEDGIAVIPVARDTLTNARFPNTNYGSSNTVAVDRFWNQTNQQLYTRRTYWEFDFINVLMPAGVTALDRCWFVRFVTYGEGLEGESCQIHATTAARGDFAVEPGAGTTLLTHNAQPTAGDLLATYIRPPNGVFSPPHPYHIIVPGIEDAVNDSIANNDGYLLLRDKLVDESSHTLAGSEYASVQNSVVASRAYIVGIPI